MNDVREKDIDAIADRICAETGLPKSVAMEAARDFARDGRAQIKVEHILDEPPKPVRRVAPVFALAAVAMAMLPPTRDLPELLIVDRPRPRPEPLLPRDYFRCAALQTPKPRPTPHAIRVEALREKRAAKMARRDERARSAGKLPEGGST